MKKWNYLESLPVLIVTVLYVLFRFLYKDCDSDFSCNRVFLIFLSALGSSLYVGILFYIKKNVNQNAIVSRSMQVRLLLGSILWAGLGVVIFTFPYFKKI